MSEVTDSVPIEGGRIRVFHHGDSMIPRSTQNQGSRRFVNESVRLYRKLKDTDIEQGKMAKLLSIQATRTPLPQSNKEKEQQKINQQTRKFGWSSENNKKNMSLRLEMSIQI
ncbi:hypothetical protein ACTXT7_013298 [Hymenolepis weldensis]